MTTIAITRETGTHKHLVSGSNPPAASFIVLASECHLYTSDLRCQLRDCLTVCLTFSFISYRLLVFTYLTFK